jgi:hypothetical protein
LISNERAWRAEALPWIRGMDYFWDNKNMPIIFYRGMGYYLTANLSPHMWTQM